MFIFGHTHIAIRLAIFYRLLAAGPIRGTSVRKNSNPSPSWGSSSKEYFSSESSLESTGLFASFTERRLDEGRDKVKGRRQTAAKSNKALLSERQISDRPFSEDTLNYVADGLEHIALNDSSSTATDNTVFESPLPPKADMDKFSPLLGTSTPNVVKGRLDEVAQSPFLINVSHSGRMVPRRGGKGWRRSAVALNSSQTPSSRATLSVRNQLDLH